MEHDGPYAKMYFPSKIKIELEKQSEDSWLLYYFEEFEKEPPADAMQTTLETLKQLGIKVRRRGNSLSYTLVGDKSLVSSIIAGEFLAYTKLGEMTLIQLLSLMTFLASKLPNIKEATSAVMKE